MGQVLGIGRTTSSPPPLLIDDIDDIEPPPFNGDNPELGVVNHTFSDVSSSDSENEEAAGQVSRSSTPELEQSLGHRNISCCSVTGSDDIDKVSDDEDDNQPCLQDNSYFHIDNDDDDDTLSSRQIRRLVGGGDNIEMLTSQAMSDAEAFIDNSEEDASTNVQTPLSKRKVIVVVAIVLILLFFGLGLGLIVGLRHHNSSTTAGLVCNGRAPQLQLSQHHCPSTNTSQACEYVSTKNVTEWHGGTNIPPTVIDTSASSSDNPSSRMIPSPNCLPSECAENAGRRWSNHTEAMGFTRHFSRNYTQGIHNETIPALTIMSALNRALSLAQNYSEQAEIAFDMACLWATGGGNGDECLSGNPIQAWHWLCGVLGQLGEGYWYLLQTFEVIFRPNNQ